MRHSLFIFMIFFSAMFFASSFSYAQSQDSFRVQNNSYTSDKESPCIILAYGDSLTAGYGLNAEEGFTGQLETWLTRTLAYPVQVINAGVSGDTSTGARARLDWTMAGLSSSKVDLVIIELGANDLLRGIDPAITRDNIAKIITFFQNRNIQVLLAGMRAPDSYGKDYQQAFESLYPDLANQYKTDLYPFFLEGVAMNEKFNQSDGIHPTKEGISIIVENIGPHIVALLNK